MSMLSARGVKVKTIDELTAAGLATVSIEHIGRGSIEVTRVKITEAGRRALFMTLALTKPIAWLDGNGPDDYGLV